MYQMGLKWMSKWTIDQQEVQTNHQCKWCWSPFHWSPTFDMWWWWRSLFTLVTPHISSVLPISMANVWAIQTPAEPLWSSHLDSVDILLGHGTEASILFQSPVHVLHVLHGQKSYHLCQVMHHLCTSHWKHALTQEDLGQGYHIHPCHADSWWSSLCCLHRLALFNGTWGTCRSQCYWPSWLPENPSISIIQFFSSPCHSPFWGIKLIASMKGLPSCWRPPWPTTDIPRVSSLLTFPPFPRTLAQSFIRQFPIATPGPHMHPPHVPESLIHLKGYQGFLVGER